MSTVKFIYDDLKINVRKRYDRWYIDFNYENKRIKRSTGLIANDENLQLIKKQIVPEIIVALTGKKEVLFFDKSINLLDFSYKYFEIHKNNVREHVYNKNLKNFNNHIKPYFKDFELDKVKPFHIESWQNKHLLKYKIATVSKYRSILYSIFEKALHNELIPFNPVSRVKSPLTTNKTFTKLDEKDNDEITPFTNNELQLILDAATGNLYYIIIVMVYTGMRPGEIIALNWNDIDYDKKRIAIDKTIVNGKVGDVKTQSSVRYVDILPILEIELKELQKKSGNYDYVFISAFKKPYYSHNVLTKRFKELVKKIDIKEREMYNLRHTFASSMITQGENILWVSRMLGHKNVDITLKTYAKYIKEDDSIRIDNLSKIVPYFVPK